MKNTELITANNIDNLQLTHRMVLMPTLLCTLVCVLSGCATRVTVDRQSFSTTLINERHNIITNAKFSDTTSASLRIAGIEESLCLSNFDDCLTQVTHSLVDNHSPESLALFAELHYAHAQQLVNSDPCLRQHHRPPINPEYANAPIDKHRLQQEQLDTSQCLASYQQGLNDALKYSFAYLFYDDLTTDGRYQPKVHLPNELDIQTLDIYHVASNEVIDNLYHISQDVRVMDVIGVNSNNDKTKNNENNNENNNNNGNNENYGGNRNNGSNRNNGNHQPLSNHTLSTLNTFHYPAVTPATQLPITDSTAHGHQVNVMSVTVADNRLNVYIPSTLHQLLQQAHSNNNNNNNGNSGDKNDNNQPSYNWVDNLIPTAEIRLSGLNSISKRQGFGLSYVAQLKGRYTNDIETFLNQSERDEHRPASRIHHTGQVLLSGYVQPTGNDLQTLLDSHQFDVHLYNPYVTNEVQIFGKPYPLMANFSAGYATWLAENHLSTTSYANMLAQRDKITLPHLYMLEPYDPNKRVIIMVHGLVSSPKTWVGVTNDIFNDNTLRDNYQVWQVFYATNIPMIENRYQIQKLIETAYAQVDPSRQNIASQHSVIISHSMGGVLSRMMLSNADLRTKLNTLTEPKQSANLQTSSAEMDDKQSHHHQSRLSGLNQLAQDDVQKLLLDAYAQDSVEDRFQLTAIPQVDMAVFINAPFRGTDFADRWFTRALRRIIHLPVGISKTIYGNLTSIIKLEGLKEQPLGALFLQNGASQLSDKSSFMKLTNDIDIDNRVTYHTILASSDKKLVETIQSTQRQSKQSQSKQHQAIQSNQKPNQTNSQQDSQLNKQDKLYKQESLSVPDQQATSKVTDSFVTESVNVTNNVTNVAGITISNDKHNNDNDDEHKYDNHDFHISNTEKVEVKGELSHTLTESISDGIVPYKSSHLEGAKSETILSGGHGIHSNPKTILVLRNILHEHLKQYPIEKNQ